MYDILQQVLSYLRSMWRYRWYAMGLTWALALGGWGFVYTLPDVYTASARVNVDTQSVLRPLMRGLTIQPDLRQRLNLMTRTLLSRPNMEKLARMTDMDIGATTEAQMQALLQRLSNQIQLEGSGRDVNIYTIKYSSSNPSQAKAVVRNLVTILMESTLGQSRENTQTAQRFLTQQLKLQEQRLREAEENLQKFKQKNSELMPTLRDGYFESLQTTKQKLAEAQQLLNEATHRRNELRRQLAGEEPVFGFAPTPGSKPDPYANSAVSELEQRIQNLQEQRDELLLQYTERHPKVVSIDETIASLKQRIEEEKEALAATSGDKDRATITTSRPLETNPVYQQLKISLAQTEAEVSALQSRVEDYRRKVEELERRVDQIPEIEGELSRLQQEYDLARKKYEEFRERQATAALSEEVEEAGEGLRIQVIDPPTVPTSPSGPNRLLFDSVVLVFALGAGVALAFVLSQIKPVVHEARTLQQLTELPIYGTVSRVWTPELLRKKRIEYGGFIAVGILLVATYGALMTNMHWGFI